MLIGGKEITDKEINKLKKEILKRILKSDTDTFCDKCGKKIHKDELIYEPPNSFVDKWCYVHIDCQIKITKECLKILPLNEMENNWEISLYDKMLLEELER